MGAAVAAVLIRREREVVDAMRVAGAVTPDRAATLETLGLLDTVAVRRLRRRAVLRESAPGALWLDEPSWEALRGTRHRVALLMLVIVVLLGASAVYATRQGANPAPPAGAASAR